MSIKTEQQCQSTMLGICFITVTVLFRYYLVDNKLQIIIKLESRNTE